MTGTWTHIEDSKASCTCKCQSTNHRAPKVDPTVAPTRIWFSVWRPCDTRNHDCMKVRLLLECVEELEIYDLQFDFSAIEMFEGERDQ
jgi:hypothetical protein